MKTKASILVNIFAAMALIAALAIELVLAVKCHGQDRVDLFAAPIPAAQSPVLLDLFRPARASQSPQPAVPVTATQPVRVDLFCPQAVAARPASQVRTVPKPAGRWETVCTRRGCFLQWVSD